MAELATLSRSHSKDDEIESGTVTLLSKNNVISKKALFASKFDIEESVR